MADIDAGTVKVNVEADTSGFTRGVTQAQRGMESLAQSAGVGAQGVSGLGMAASVAGGIIGADLVKSVLNAAQSVARFAVDVTKAAGKAEESLSFLSQETGISVQEFDRMIPVLNRTGISTDLMATGFRTLSRRITEARNPTSQAAEMFNRLGIAITGLETPSQVFQLLTQRLGAMSDGAEKSAALQELLGRAGTRLGRVFNEGAAGFTNFSAAAAHAALILNTDAKAALTSVDDSFDDLKTSSDDLSKHLGVLFAPFIQSLNTTQLATTNWLTTMVDQFTVATRTMSQRWQAFSNFLDLAFDKNVNKNFANTAQIWEETNKKAAESIATIRELGVTVKGSGEEQSAANTAASRAQAGIVALGDAQELLGKKILIANVALAQQRASLFGSNAVQVATDLSAKFGTTVTPEQIAKQEQLGADIVRRAMLVRANAVSEYGAATVAAREQILQLQGVDVSYSQIVEQETLGLQMRTQQVDAWKNSLIDAQAVARRAAADAAVVQSANGGSAFGAGANRSAALNAIAAETAARRVAASQAIIDQQQLETELETIDREGLARRMNVAQQFPTFWQSQLQAIVSSNSFSIAQITTTWTSGLANAAITGGQFVQQAWQSTQIAILQGAINFGVQMAAQWALRASVELGILSATEAAKLGLIQTANATRLASDTATAGASVGVWGGASAAIVGFYGTVAGGFSAISATLIATVSSVATFIEGVLVAIAEALADTVFGIPWAVAILAGVAAIAAAVALSGAIKFAKGGIATGPTLGMVGEAGSPEAMIPLNATGAKFMAEMLGLNGGGQQGAQVISIDIDGASFKRFILEGMPKEVRLRAGAIA